MGGPGGLEGGLTTAGDAQLRAKERAENFPVALRVLPRRVRRHLVAIYDVVRVIDDLGDEAAGDRTAQLEAFAEDLARVWAGGTPRAEVLRRLVPTVRATGLPRELFDRMVAANLQDQRVSEYATYHELLEYCTLSANPVGRMVLCVFGVSSPTAGELSDRVCTALQLVEHWQDVAEDRRRGRVYLPKRGYGPVRSVTMPIWTRAAATPALRRLMAFQTERAAGLLDSGAPLVGELPAGPGWPSPVTWPGRAAVDALRRCGGEVLAATPRPASGTCWRTPPPTPAHRRAVHEHPGGGIPGVRGHHPTQARNFYYGIRLLPGAKRAALCAVYALARRIDDIGDGDLPAEQKLDRADRAAPALRQHGRQPGPGARRGRRRRPALPDPAGRLRRAGGRRADGRRRAQLRRPSTSWSGYCRCVAGSVGRLSPGRVRQRGAATRRRRRTPTRSASPCSRPTSCATSGRTSATGGSTCRSRPRPVRREAEARTNGATWRTRTASWPRLISFRRRAGPAAGTTEGLHLLPLLDRRSAACAARWPASTAGCWPGSRPTRPPVYRPADVAVRLAEGRGSRRGALIGTCRVSRGSSVVGGGLAGITAALRLADAGCEVTLLEARPKLGGLTYSFQRGELSVDNGQHVFLRCCTAYLDLLDRLGVADQATLQPRLDIPVPIPGRPGARAGCAATALPAPLHLAGRCCATARSASPSGSRVVRAALALRRLDRADPAVDQQTFGAWLAAHGQGDAGRARRCGIWSASPRSTRRPATRRWRWPPMVFQTGLLDRPPRRPTSAGRWCRCSELHGDAGGARCSGSGPAPTVRTGAKVRAPHRRGRRLSG